MSLGHTVCQQHGYKRPWTLKALEGGKKDEELADESGG